MLEYLILNGKLSAAKHFHENSQTSIRQQLISLFNKGNREQFMELFSLLHKQSKLQFYLRVYFLIYSIHPSLRGKSAIPEPQKIAFKDYLDTKGAQLAKTNQFLQFYALPFIKKPLEHLAFKNLFKRQWVINLKQKLQIFINDQQRRLKNQISKFVQSQSNYSSGVVPGDVKALNEKVKQMQKINKKLFEQVKQFTQKYHILEDSHKMMMQGFNTHMMQSQSKWFQITKQLVQCSKSLIQMLISSGSDYLSDRKFLKIKKRTQKYERFVSKKFDDLVTHSQDISIFDRPSISQLSYSVTPHSQKNLTQVVQICQDYMPTDFQSVKELLKKSGIQQKISIINGFYWRILKSKTKQIRKLNILGMLHYDVLGIDSGQIQNLILSRQLMKPIVRLLQVISLDNLGKKLAFTNSLLKDFVGLINQCQDTSCFEYIISALGQISSEKCFKLSLINLDIIQACVSILRDPKHGENQTILENTVAIMLNMLEKSQALRKYERQRDIFQILKRHLISKYRITRTLTCGIIFALLQSQQLFKRAHAQKMPQFFENVLSNDPSINKLQLKYLKNKLAHFQPKQKEVQQQEDDYDYNDQEQDIEIEDQYICELDEMMKSHDEVLIKHHLKGKQAIMQTKLIKQLLQQYKENRIPRFNNIEQKVVLKISSPKLKPFDEQAVETPYIKQLSEREQLIKSQKPARKLNNYLSNDNNNKQNKQVKQKQRPNKLQQVRNPVDTENDERRMKKSVSADRGIGRANDNKHIYQSNRFNKITEFKAAEQRNYRSPQQKKPRQEVLKQLNEQIKAQKKKVNTESHRENQASSYVSQKPRRGEQYTQVFLSRPKLRRTPPRQ